MSTDYRTQITKIHSSCHVSYCEEILDKFGKEAFYKKLQIVAAAALTLIVATFGILQATNLLTAPNADPLTLAGIFLGSAIPTIGLAIATYNLWKSFQALDAVCYAANQRISALNGICFSDYSSLTGKTARQE